MGNGTHFVALHLDLSHDIDFEFSLSNFEKAVFPESVGRLTWNERNVGR